MKLCRFKDREGRICAGLMLSEAILFDLTPAGVERLEPLLESRELLPELEKLAQQNLPRHPLVDVQLLTPVERQEVWAAGVTYLRSKTARMEESTFSANAYDRVYDAARPELFFKSMPEKVVSPGDAVGIRGDGQWNVPEPELALVINSRGEIVGYTIGNDMSSRDIEGDNLLYLPQAKVYSRSCALGPAILVGSSEEEARRWQIELVIERDQKVMFEGRTSVAQIKRSFSELVQYLFRSQEFPHGAILLTGTGIVPGDEFSLQSGDVVRMSISSVGVLMNPVVEV